MGLLLSTRRAATGAPAAWTPADIRGLTVWLDADDMNGNGDGNSGWTDGDAVTTWADKSGNSNSPTQAVAGKAVAESLSVDSVLSKPFSYEKVKSVLETVLDAGDAIATDEVVQNQW